MATCSGARVVGLEHKVMRSVSFPLVCCDACSWQRTVYCSDWRAAAVRVDSYFYCMLHLSTDPLTGALNVSCFTHAQQVDSCLLHTVRCPVMHSPHSAHTAESTLHDRVQTTIYQTPSERISGCPTSRFTHLGSPTTQQALLRGKHGRYSRLQ